MSQQNEKAAEILVSNYLGEARKALEDQDLDKAYELYHESLNVDGRHPNRAAVIREDLHKSSDDYSSNQPPKWELAYQALKLISELKLGDKDSLEWQVDLRLKEAKMLLEQEERGRSFEIFEALSSQEQWQPFQAKIKDERSEIVRKNILQLADDQKWDSLREVIGGVKELSVDDEEVSQWLDTIEIALSNIKDVQEQNTKIDEQANQIAAYEAQINALEVENSTRLNQVQQQSQRLVYGLAAGYIVLAIVFIFLLVLF